MSEAPPDPWYVSAFDDSYLRRYAHRDEAEARRQVTTLARLLPLDGPSRVLDLCCGGGRHTALLRRRGWRPVGVDLSHDLLLAARETVGGRSPLARADMSALPFRDASFDTVIQMFTAFGYFPTDDQNLGVLAEVRRVLRRHGGYALDLMNLAPTLAGLVPRDVTQRDGVEVEQRRSFDEATRRIEKVILTRRGDAEERRSESVRVFEPDEIRAWLRDADLEVERIAGDYDGADYSPESSPRMLLFARAV